jgi:hypothetical protein
MKRIIYVVGFIVIIASCRPAKKVQHIEQAISKKDTSERVVAKPEETEKNHVDSFVIVKNIVGEITEHPIDFTTFSAKVKIAYEGKENSDAATAYVRIKKDSVIWISLTGALGIEGMRVIIKKDSVKLLNKLQKTVQFRSIAYLQELAEIPFDFYNIQDVIIGNPVFLDTNHIVSYQANGQNLLVLMIGNIFKNLLTLDEKSYKVLHSKLDDVDSTRNRTADITYDDYENAGSFDFSTKRKITVAEQSKLDIDLDFKSYNFNRPQDYPFNIPKNYKRR